MICYGQGAVLEFSVKGRLGMAYCWRENHKGHIEGLSPIIIISFRCSEAYAI